MIKVDPDFIPEVRGVSCCGRSSSLCDTEGLSKLEESKWFLLLFYCVLLSLLYIVGA